MPRNSNLAELLGVLPHQFMKTNNIEQDRYDARLYRDLLEASPELGNLAGQGPATWPALLQDIWAGFYKAGPELVPEEQVETAHRTNRPFVERFLEDQTTAEARLTTVLDELSAGLATLATGRKLLEEIKERPELKQALEQAEEALQTGEDGNEEMAAGFIAQAQQALQQAAREVRRAVRVAAEAGQEKAQELQQALAGWGLEPGDLQRVPLGERLKLAERLTGPRLKRLADLVGRFRNLARARQKEKLKKERDEIHGITIGADLGRVLPAELAMLKNPLRRMDFYRRYTEKQLLQYELRAKEKLGRGPVICLIDASGSMAGAPMDWAIAVALGLLDTATRQRRRTAVIFFDTRVLAEYEFAPGERDIEKIIAIATTGTAGGTDYEPALERARKLILESKYEKADIVMVTDGICRVSENFLEDFLLNKKLYNFRTWSVLIGYGSAEELKRWSDQVWSVRQPTDEVAGEVFEQVY